MIEKLKNVFNIVSERAVKKYDTTKLELKIKGYKKEEQARYSDLGKMLYKSNKTSSEMEHTAVNNICDDIDNIKHRINNLEVRIKNSNFKNSNEPLDVDGVEIEAEVGIVLKDKKYAKLNKNNNDLALKRTEDGISLLKFCKECEIGNHPDAESCENCGAMFK